MAANDGGPAFPRAGYDGPEYHEDGTHGMSLRDYFAGQALTGMLAAIDPHWNEQTGGVFPENHEIARIAYMYADAMIAAKGLDK